MATVTLLGTRLASRGTEFVYQGGADGCAGCPYRDQCLNLTPGRTYRVTDVRENAQQLECAMHEDGVRAVEVEPTEVRATVDTKASYAGSSTTLPGPCPYVECPSHAYCEPPGVDHDETFRIDRILGDPPHEVCHLDRSLQLAALEPDD